MKKIKYISYFITIILIVSSCKSSLKNRSKHLTKTGLTYIDSQFTFKYPKNWSTFNTKGFEKNVIIRVSPKKEIYEEYMVIDTKSKDGTANSVFFFKLDTNKDSISLKYRKFLTKDNIRKFSNNQFNISIEDFSDKNLSEFVKKRKEKIENTSYVEGFFEKISDNHFINYIFIFNNEDEKSPTVNQLHLMHYYQENNKLFTLVFSSTPDKYEEYVKEVELIFNSFKFI